MFYFSSKYLRWYKKYLWFYLFDSLHSYDARELLIIACHVSNHMFIATFNLFLYLTGWKKLGFNCIFSYRLHYNSKTAMTTSVYDIFNQNIPKNTWVCNDRRKWKISYICDAKRNLCFSRIVIYFWSRKVVPKIIRSKESTVYEFSFIFYRRYLFLIKLWGKKNN